MSNFDPFFRNLVGNVTDQYGEYHTYPVGSKDTEHDLEGAHKIYSSMPSPQEIFQRATFGLKYLITEELLEELNDPIYLTQVLSSVIVEFEQKHSTSLSPRFVKETVDGTTIKRNTDNCMYTRLTYRPVTHIEGLWWCFPHGESSRPTFQYMIPPQWIALKENKINVVPDFGFVPNSSGGFNYNMKRYPILRNLSRRTFNPSEWIVRYKYGYEHDKIPSTLVEIVTLKTIAAIFDEMASVLIPISSMTTSIDSVSQSAATPGQDILLQKAQRMKDRADELERNMLNGEGNTITIDFIE